MMNRNNTFHASDWFDMNFLVEFLNSDLKIIREFNEQKFTIGEENISSRVLNHWCEMGLITDDRVDKKSWKKFSASELLWIRIIIKLRNFGLDLKRIKQVKASSKVFVKSLDLKQLRSLRRQMVDFVYVQPRLCNLPPQSIARKQNVVRFFWANFVIL